MPMTLEQKKHEILVKLTEFVRDNAFYEIEKNYDTPCYGICGKKCFFRFASMRGDMIWFYADEKDKGTLFYNKETKIIEAMFIAHRKMEEDAKEEAKVNRLLEAMK